MSCDKSLGLYALPKLFFSVFNIEALVAPSNVIFWTISCISGKKRIVILSQPSIIKFKQEGFFLPAYKSVIT